MKGYATLRDIAERAGISTNSVSRALKDCKDIGSDTKAYVKQIAKELGYIPHAAASNLRSGASKSIGVIVTRIDNAFFSRILQGINDCVSALGYTVLTLASNEDVEAERRAITLLTSYRVSGMLLVPANDLKSNLDYGSIQAPHIEIVRPAPTHAGVYFIADSRRSGELAAEHLIAVGRNKLAYLGFDMSVSCNMERLKGYSDRIRKLGRSFGKQQVRTCDATSEAAVIATKQWIAEGFDMDGLFVYNDAMAFGVLRAFADAGIRVPEDVSVIGHDDVEVAQSFIPRLTTIQVPKYRLGMESARALLELIDPGLETSMLQHVVYEPELIIRET
ncbi:MAG: LacI family DNA-binding transcriptional regulator [Spirochaetes bacterium]|nr:LacI family DNA-binding transcriptional regulator [Spirochaetota bacterium]